MAKTNRRGRDFCVWADSIHNSVDLVDVIEHDDCDSWTDEWGVGLSRDANRELLHLNNPIETLPGFCANHVWSQWIVERRVFFWIRRLRAYLVVVSNPESHLIEWSEGYICYACVQKRVPDRVRYDRSTPMRGMEDLRAVPTRRIEAHSDVVFCVINDFDLTAHRRHAGSAPDRHARVHFFRQRVDVNQVA